MTQSAPEETLAQRIEGELTGTVLTDAEADVFGRQLQKGCGFAPYEAYRVGVRDGIVAALEAVARSGRPDRPAPDESASETPSEAGETASAPKPSDMPPTSEWGGDWNGLGKTSAGQGRSVRQQAEQDAFDRLNPPGF